MILVTGATGNAGAEVARALAASGHPVRALTRDPSSARLPAGVAAQGDLTAGGRNCATVTRCASPQALLPAERLAILGEVLGRPLRLVPQPDDEVRDAMSTEHAGAAGGCVFRVLPGRDLPGQRGRPDHGPLVGPPRTFRDWVHAHAHAGDFTE